LEGTAQRLSPEFSLAEVLPPFHATMVGRRFSPRRVFGRLQDAYHDWERLARSLPRDLTDVVRGMREGTFAVRLDHRHLDPVINRLVLGLLTAALLVSSALLWSMKASPMIGGVSVLGAVGYAVAAYLGWRLLRALKKTGDVGTKL